MSRCIAIASGKGGVGKSVFTAGLGASLAREGLSVVIIDADIGLRSQDALLSLENRVVYDLLDLSAGACEPDQALLPCEACPSLRLLPAAQFARAKALDPRKLRKIIASLAQSCDFILIDCPAGIERGLRNVLNAEPDETLLVSTPDDISLRSAERALQVMDQKKVSRPSLIVNRLDPLLIRSGEMMCAKTAAALLDLRLLGEIPEDPLMYRAQLRHTLFSFYDCEAGAAVRRIAARVLGKQVPFPDYGSKKPPLFRRLLSGRLKEVVPLDNH